jgi:sulfate adenylyltransferase subunit 2
MKLTHLQRLEAESIHIMREVVAETEKPVMLYSVGKDSATMLHLARKAFYPSPPPFPLLHVDTTWKFREMYELRDLSNWTELDIWQYIYLENIAIVPLYFAALRPVVERDGTLIMVDDERLPLQTGEVPMMRKVRFRTLGCYPLTGAIESDADSLPAIIQEMLLARTSERQGRLIDHDTSASMEKKKQEGYF